MKIAYILPVNMKNYGYTKESFIETHFAVDIAREVARQGHEVSLHTFWDEKSVYHEKKFNIHFYHPSFNKIFNTNFAEISTELLQKKFPEDTIIHFHEPNRLFSIPFLLSKKNLIITEHHSNGIVNPFPITSKFYWFYGIFRRIFLSNLLKKCDAHIVHTKIALKNFKEYGIRENKIFRLPNGIDLRKYNRYNKNRVRKKMGIGKEIVFLFAGRIHPSKGIRELVSAFENVKVKNENIKLILLGPLQKQELKDLVEPYWKGFKNPEELQKWLSAADVFVLPTYAECFSIALLEALYYNLPIITTEVGGSPEFVPEENAIFIPPKNEKMLEKAIEKMLDSNIRAKKGRGGKDLVKQKYTWEKVCSKYLQIYEKINSGYQIFS